MIAASIERMEPVHAARPAVQIARAQSWFGTVLAGVLTARRERQAAEIERILRQGLAAAR